MTTDANKLPVSGTLTLDTGGEGGFGELAPEGYVCITVWGTVETNENGELSVAVEEAAIMPSDEEGEDSEELEEEAQPAAAALMKRSASPGKPPASVVSVMIGKRPS